MKECHKCGIYITPNHKEVERFGHSYHSDCVPEIDPEYDEDATIDTNQGSTRED